MNKPNSEPGQFPSAAKPAMSSVLEKLSTRSDLDPRRNGSWAWEETKMESTTLLPPPNYRYPRRGAFTHSGLLRSAVLASIATSESCDDDGNEIRQTSSLEGCNVKLFDLTLQGKPSPLKRSRNVSDMEDAFDITENAFISKSVDVQSLSIRLPDLSSTSPRRVSLRWAQPSPQRESSETSS